MGDLLIMDAVKKDGGDPKAVSFVELPYPNMEAALKSGQVDAVWTPEPFMTIIKKAGNPVVTYPGVASVKGHPTMMYFTSGQLAQSKPELVSKMAKAMNTAMDYAQAHPDEVRDKASSALKIDPALAKDVVLEDFGGPVRKDELTEMGALMKEYGVIEKDADVAGLLQSVPAN
jgi:NitT/TauT family transport system substrate-binding protein